MRLLTGLGAVPAVLAMLGGAWAHTPRSDRSPGSDADLLIAGGQVFDGSLDRPVRADVAIKGDRIVFVGDAQAHRLRASRIIDARGDMVVPGFIDAHSHALEEMQSSTSADRLVARQLLQGVTTSVVGVDGSGTPDIAQQAHELETAGVGQNFASYVGFGAIRKRVIGERARAPDPDELRKMKLLAAQGMCEGALGVSTSLYYAPQNFASTEEVIAVVKEAGLRGGIYDTHQRDEGRNTIGILASMREAIRIGRESGAPLHIAHLKVSGGWDEDPALMGKVIELVEEARAQGQHVTADQYPWSASATSFAGAVIPPWVHEGGKEAMLRRLEDPAAVSRVKVESRVARLGAARIMISNAPEQPDIVGKSLAEIAESRGMHPIDAAIEILKKSTDVGAVLFSIRDEDVTRVMPQPWLMTSSDGSQHGGHPRGYATYPKLWSDYVVRDKILSPEQFVHRSTGLVADVFGLQGRGYLRPGYFADVAVIDPRKFAAHATYAQPTLLSTGVAAVVVNGKLEVDDGRPTGITAGRGLFRQPSRGSCP